MRILLFLYLWFSNISNYSQNINIRIYENKVIDTFEFTAVEGRYDIIAKDSILRVVEQGEKLLFTIRKGKINIEIDNELVSVDSFLLLRASHQSNYFKISSPNKVFKSREFDNELYVKYKNNNFELINDVNFDKYIAGVVEAEGGAKAPIEYYKAQAVLCRTYAARYYQKHLHEGYNLCSGVHCQAYNGRCSNQFILKSAIETTGLIIVDSEQKIISATFYANSGGQTVTAEDLWNTPHSYLQSKHDPYSIGKPGDVWSKEFQLADWKKYLSSKGYAVSDSVGYSFYQPNRLRYFTYNGNDSLLELKTMRTDLKLRSTYFSVEQVDNKIVLKGRGYGHGVGLSQEGAMEMARQNFTYDKIIKFYFTGVQLKNITSVSFFQIE